MIDMLNLVIKCSY